jgi:L-lactate dehydrogenase (cytochrome)
VPTGEVESALAGVYCLEDFERPARARLPKPLFGYFAGWAETGQSHDQNRAAFKALDFVPRALVDVSKRSQTTTLFGKVYRSPFGIAPMGLAGLTTFEGDIVLARAAAAQNIPMIVSATSIAPLERIAREGKAHWFQAYLPGEANRIEAMIDRVGAAGFDTFVLTVDVQVAANRENNLRNGFSIPLRPSLRLLFEGLSHPSWTLGTWVKTFLVHGMPHFENMDAFRGPPLLSRHLERQIGARDQLNWTHVDLIRKKWPGKFVVKGLLATEDVATARAAGVDGVIISNHGGRQLDGAASPLRVLREIKDIAGPMTLMLDSGVRRGSDVIKALAMGADFVFVGRPFVFSAAIGRDRGVNHAITLLAAEIDRDMAMLGIRHLGELSATQLLFR